MSLISKLFRRERNADLGPVSFMIITKEDSDKQKTEAALRTKGIKPYQYLELSKVFFCTAPKNVYEEVFNAKLVEGDHEMFGDTPEGYKEKKSATIPDYLEHLVEGVAINSVCIGTPESVAAYHNSKSFWYRLKNYFRRR
ncbi:MAG: hypothetical protein AABX16_03855 [Nanoarchaeota archaeon]